MKTIELKGTARKAVGKKDAKLLRRNEQVPCVLYGGTENHHFSVNLKDLKKIVYTPKVYIIDIDIDGQNYNAIMQDLQFHPVSDDILHIDFLQVVENKPVIINIPVILEGFAKGVQAGGKLSQLARTLKVKALAKDLPDDLTVDVTNLELGKSIKVGELNFENIELLDSKNAVVAAVKLTRAAKGMSGEGSEEAEQEEKQEAAE